MLKLPELSTYAGQIDHLILLIAVLTGFWFLVAEGVFFWLIFKFRAKPGVKSQYLEGHEHHPSGAVGQTPRPLREQFLRVPLELAILDEARKRRRIVGIQARHRIGRRVSLAELRDEQPVNSALRHGGSDIVRDRS